MDQDVLYDVVILALRVTFLVVVPLICTTLIAGVLAGVFQAATTVQESTISYAAKMLAVVVLTGVFFSTLAGLLMRLAELAWR